MESGGSKRVSTFLESSDTRCGARIVEAVSATGQMLAISRISRHDPLRGQCQAGSLTGAVHLSNDNTGVLRLAQRGQKPRVEQKGKCWLDPDFQYEYGPRKRGLSILLSC
jgi:hypothetical protein